MKWLYKAQREFPAHIVFILKEAYTKGTKETLGWDDKEFLYVLKEKVFISYRSKKNDQEMYAFFKEKVKDKKFLQELKAKTEQARSIYKEETEKIREGCCKKEQSWEQLSSLYKRAYNAEYQLLSIMNFTLYFEQAGHVPEEAKTMFEEIAKIRNNMAAILYAFYHDDYGGLFRKIQEKVKLPKELVGFMLPEEIGESLKRQKATVTQNELNERRKLSVLVVENKEARYLVGKEAEKIYEELQSETKEQTEIKGQTAYSGKVQGTVCKVETHADLKKIKKGVILVTPMTSVTYIPYVEKVAGIVTDEGGIICHAASIAREMKIPTIIGTKTASKILKDGDLIEVDAQKGIVRKIQ